MTQGPAAQIAYNISKLAEMRTVEQLSYQFEREGLLAASVHPGAVLTKLSASHLPEDLWHMLEDEKGLCGATCVWLTKRCGRYEEVAEREVLEQLLGQG